VQLFPLDMGNRLRNRALRSTHRNLLRYNSAAVRGVRELRENLAAYLRESRGVRREWWQVAITSGSQQALYLLAQLLLKAGDRVYMEDPGHQGAVRTWRAAGTDIQYLPIDAEGVITPVLVDDPGKLIYVTPSRQFPTGVSLSLSRRLAPVNGAVDSGAWIVEDDYDSEFRYGAPSAQSAKSRRERPCHLYRNLQQTPVFRAAPGLCGAPGAAGGEVSGNEERR
jgi:GntR family transcriptional regulator/MocR family aminotransferase